MITKSRRTAAKISCVAMLFAAACASEGGIEAIDEVETQTSTNVVPAEEAAPQDAGRFADDTLDEAFYEAMWDGADFWSAALNADAVFVGTVIGTSKQEFVEGPDMEDPLRSTTEWDGVLFSIDEVIKGDAKVGEVLTVAHPAVVVTGETIMRVEDHPIDEILPVLRSFRNSDVKAPEDQQFLVLVGFAEDLQLHMFMGPNSIVPMGSDTVFDSSDRFLSGMSAGELAAALKSGERPRQTPPTEEDWPEPGEPLGEVQIEEPTPEDEKVEQSPPDPDTDEQPVDGDR